MKKEVIQKINELQNLLGILFSSIPGVGRISNIRLLKKEARKAYFTCLQIERLDKEYDVKEIKEKIIPIIDNDCYIENMEGYQKGKFDTQEIKCYHPRR